MEAEVAQERVSSMLSPTKEVTHVAERPITQNEMQALLGPLQESLQRLESKLSNMAVPSKELGVFAKSRMELGAECSAYKDPELRSSTESAGEQSFTGSGGLKAFLGMYPTNTLDRERTSSAEARTSEEASEAVATGVSRCKMLSDMDGKIFEFMEVSKINRALQKLTNDSAADKVSKLVDKHLLSHCNFQEPVRTSWISKFTKSYSFETACQCAIILNAGLVASGADWQLRHIGVSEPEFVRIGETCFVMFFSIELMLRLMTHRCYFFLNEDMRWNIFDFILVTFSMLDVVMTKILVADSGNNNVVFARTLRVFKLARILRSLRLFRFFRSLSLLLHCVQNSCMVLFWGSVMLAFALYFFALVFMQGMVDYKMRSAETDPDDTFEIDYHFGSLGSTLISLYMSVTGGFDWRVYYDILCEVGAMYGGFFIFFTFFVLFALFNIITGLLVENAVNSARPERSDMILNQRRQFIEEKRAFLEICHLMDSDGSGKISCSEFYEWMTNPVMVLYLASVGIDVHDVDLFFHIVKGNAGEDEIAFEHFVDGLMQMKGGATAVDMQRQLFESHLLREDLNKLEVSFNERQERLERLVHNGFASARNFTVAHPGTMDGQNRVEEGNLSLVIL